MDYTYFHKSEKYDKVEIVVTSDKQWLEDKKALAPQQRNIGFVFQDYALFENMTVEENLLFVKDDRKLSKYLLEVTALSSLKKRLPNMLSGGQKQRVSLCRALMNRPNRATLLVGQQLIEVELSQEEVNRYKVGTIIPLVTDKIF